MTSENYWRTNNKTNVRFESSDFEEENAFDKVNSKREWRWWGRTYDEKVPIVGAFKVKKRTVEGKMKRFCGNEISNEQFMFLSVVTREEVLSFLFCSAQLFLPFFLSFNILRISTIHHDSKLLYTHTESERKFWDMKYSSKQMKTEKKKTHNHANSGAEWKRKTEITRIEMLWLDKKNINKLRTCYVDEGSEENEQKKCFS